MGVICSDCLFEWDQKGMDWKEQPIHAVTLVDGNSLCVSHFRVRVLHVPQEEATV